MGEKVLKDDVLRFARTDPSACMRCGRCTAACNAFDEMEYHPHQFVYMIESGRIDELLSSPSLYRCMSCFSCVEHCPRQVDPAGLIEAVRAAAQRNQGADHFTPDDLVLRIDDDLPQQAVVSAFRKFKR